MTLGKGANLGKFTNLMGLKHKLNEITDPKEPGVKPGACWLIHLHLFLFCLEGSRETKNQNKRVGAREEGKNYCSSLEAVSTGQAERHFRFPFLFPVDTLLLEILSSIGSREG